MNSIRLYIFNSVKNIFYIFKIYIAKIILRHNSKDIARILAIIVNCEMCIVNCNIYRCIVQF